MHAVPSSGRAPLRLMRRLNLFGLDFLDPIVLAALADERPLLLIGPHGTAKSELLNRVAATLGLEHRHYNASLISFDDLLGYPVPDAERGTVKYLRTPGDLWDARVRVPGRDLALPAGDAEQALLGDPREARAGAGAAEAALPLGGDEPAAHRRQRSGGSLRGLAAARSRARRSLRLRGRAAGAGRPLAGRSHRADRPRRHAARIASRSRRRWSSKRAGRSRRRPTPIATGRRSTSMRWCRRSSRPSSRSAAAAR